MMKKLSLKGLADFMTASPTRQRKILSTYKYPSEDEAQAKILYYREARDRICAYHSSKHGINWLINESTQLNTLANLSVGLRRSRLRHNARGVALYATHFGTRNFDVLDDFSQDIQFGDVFVSVYPDLHVRENGHEKLIKLEFAKNAPDEKIVKIISQCMFNATVSAGLNLPSSSILYFDVPRGMVYKGARMGSRMAKDVEATCMNISAIWDSI